MTFQAWLAFVGASMLLLLIPGPTILLVIGDSLSNRGRSPLSTVAGVTLGDSTSIAVSLAGAGALLAASASAFTLLKAVGGAYLLYLGIKSIRQARAQGHARMAVPVRSARRRFASAWTVTALNPKSIVFFVAFLPQFITPGQAYLPQAAILLATFVALSLLNASLYALLARLLSRRLTQPATQRRFGYAGGAALLGAGTLTLALHR